MARSPNPLRDLPGVDRLLGQPGAEALIDRYGRGLAVEAVRASLEDARQRIQAGGGQAPSDRQLIEAAGEAAESWLAPTLRRVVNATGVIVHTNLGRAPLARSALEAIARTALGYSTLEYDLEAGARGSRSLHADGLLRRVTGAEAALVVNNNAAAVLLALTALAGPGRGAPTGRQVIVSRGQLVEIGGGFRVPDVMAQSGAHLVEVGATNRTHLRDYEDAITPETALIVRAHRSNFALIGFTAEPSLAELAELAHRRGLLLADDLGSGALIDTARFGLAAEPMVQASLSAGADVVMFSGDKLLGGPQAGIVVGRAGVVERLKAHPLARAVRADKLCLAALAATLGHYLRGDALTAIPVWQMIAASEDDLRARAESWAGSARKLGLEAEVRPGQSTVGGGSLPGQSLPTALLSLRVESPDGAAACLRRADPPVIARIEDDRLALDPRTVLPDDEPALLRGLALLAGAS